MLIRSVLFQPRRELVVRGRLPGFDDQGPPVIVPGREARLQGERDDDDEPTHLVYARHVDCASPSRAGGHRRRRVSASGSCRRPVLLQARGPPLASLHLMMCVAPTGPRAARCSARSGRAEQQYDKTAAPANESRCIAARAAVTHGTLRISISSDHVCWLWLCSASASLPLRFTTKVVVGGERNPRATRSVRVPGAIVIASGVPSRDLLRGAAPSQRRRVGGDS